MTDLQEFWYCVAPQSQIPLYRGESMDDAVVESLLEFVEFCRTSTAPSLPETLRQALLTRPASIADIRLLLGISDKRFYLDMTYLSHICTTKEGRRLVEEARQDLIKHSTAYFVRRLRGPMGQDWAEVVADYFLSNGLEEILTAFLSLSEEQVRQIFNNLIAPKEIQQKQAKYRGHGAEQAVAQSFFDVGAILYPPQKHRSPMAERDPNVDLHTMKLVSHEAADAGVHSFDLLIRDEAGRIRVLVQSLIHTSDPGQYGVNKSDETVEIKRLVQLYNQSHPDARVYLFGNVDGVGFSENPNGTIAKLLRSFDGFAQMNTLFKTGLFLQQVGLLQGIRYVCLDEAYFSPEAMEHFRRSCIAPAGAELVQAPPAHVRRAVPAGRGTLYF